MYMRQVSFKLLDFNVYDDNIITEKSSKYRDNREFMVQVFGLNEKGETASIFIEGFTPFFYVKVDESWTESKKTCFINELKNRIGTFYEDSIVKGKLIQRKTLYGFDAGKMHHFVQIIFKNTMALNRARKLWYDESYGDGKQYSKSLKPDGYIYEGTSTYLYESNFPPLLRLFHIMEISPSGWIALPERHFLRHDKKRRTTTCTHEYTIEYRYIISLNTKNNPVPYKQCSFDIEASSSHGDFPVPIKNYKKLAIDMVNKIVKTGDHSIDAINRMILAAFNIAKCPEINNVFTKSPIIEDAIHDLLPEFATIIPKTIKLDEEMEDDCEVEEPEEEDEEETMENGAIPLLAGNDLESVTGKSGRRRRTFNNKTSTIIEILQDDTCEYKLKVKELCKTLTHVFPPLEGDRVTFIGSTIKLYGADDYALKHCIVLNGCEIPEEYRENYIIECYDTEREVLLAWQKFIQRENPDIVTGYNINGFDFDFMYRRTKELKCTKEFLKLSRNQDEVCLNRDWRTGKESIETMKIVLASGEYNLKYVKMTGRIILDLYIYFRREYQLSSYKLDHTASQFICDDVKKTEFLGSNDNNDNNDDKPATVIYSKNLKGINPGDYINFEEISYSTEYYKKGKKFIVRSIDPDARSFTIDGHEELNMEKKVKWGIAKDDVPPQEIFRLSNGDDRDRGIVAMYCIKDCKLVQDIIDKIDLLTGFIEMSNYCSVPMSFLLFRGQGIKLQSYVGKKCREKDTLMPTLDKSEDEGGYEGAIVLEPKTDIYLEDPVACVDYSSLYPSSMISENLSHDSKVWTREYNLDDEEIKVWGERDPLTGEFIYDNLPEYTYIDVVYDTYEYVRKTPKSAAVKVRSGYKICRFAQLPKGKGKSIMPSILEELLAARKSTKQLMNKAFADGDLFMGNIYENRQLTIKVTANSLYGQCGAKTSVFYDKDVAASTTAVGRKLLIYARDVIETAYRNRIITLNNSHIVKTNAEYVYGDSVAEYTPVYIRINDKIMIISIDNIVEKYGNNEWRLSSEPERQDKEFCDLTENQDNVIFTWTDKGWTRLKTVIRHRLASHKKMYRILTHTGVVDVTDDHSLLTKDGQEISPNNVEIGTELLHKTIEFTESTNDPDEIDIQRAKIYGFFFGDGSCGYYNCKSGKKASWALNNKSPNIINKYLELCRNAYPEFTWQVYNTLNTSNVYKISFNASKYGRRAEFIKKYREITYYKNHKIIPDFILNSPYKIRNAFWEGIYDADGDKDENGNTRIDQKSQISSANIALLANSIGYKTSINTRIDKPDIYRITCTKKAQRKNPSAVKKIIDLNLVGDFTNKYVYDLTTENHHFAAGIGNMIVHNTDSIFFKFNLRDKDGNKIVGREALEITIELAKEAGHLATKFLKQPHDLEYEKTFMPFILLSKKRYVGMLYENDPDKGKIKFMGIVLKRRDNAAIVKDIYGGIIDKIVKEKSIVKAMKFCRESLQNMVDEKYPIEKLIVTKSLRGFYKNPKQIAHNVLADRIGDREQGNRPLPGDRIEYAYIKNPDKRALQGEKIETPSFIHDNDMKIDYAFYITNQIMKPILQLFALAVEDMNELKKRYGNSLNKWYRMLAELQERWPEEEKFTKKFEELKCKEAKAIIFDDYLNQLK